MLDGEVEETPIMLEGLWPANENGFQVHPTNGRWTTNAGGSTGAVGNPTTLTWGFMADGASIPASGSIAGESSATSTLQARLNTLYGNSATWQPVFQAIFDRWSVLSGLTFTFKGFSDDGAAFPNSSGNANRADMRIGGHPIDGGTGNNVLAYCYFPNSGDMVIDTDNFNAGSFYTNTSNNSRPLRNVLGHEMGHGLGFNHVDPINQTKLMEASTTSNPIFDGPQFDDILIAQRQYGDPFEKGGRNETPATASNLGTLGNSAGALISQWANANNPTNARSIANTSDSDYLKFTVTSTKNVSFTLTPFGPTYSQGPQGGPTASFNAAADGDLAFALFDTNGTTVLSNVNATAAGGVETVTASNLAPGTYFLRASMTSGDVQPYNVSATISDAVVVPPAPSTPDLAAASDSGVSTIDNLTNDNTPTFTGTAEANSTISLRVDGVQVAMTVTSAGGAWTVTTPLILDGPHAITAIATNGAGPGPVSGSLAVTIDTVGPVASTPQFVRLTHQGVTVSFDSSVTGTGTLTLNNVTAPQAFVTVPTTTSATSLEYLVSGNALTDGKYTGTLNLFSVNDAAGNAGSGAASVAFNFLRADFNEDDAVNFADLVVLAQNYNLAGQNHAQGNANYSGDGLVDFGDLVILAQTYNVSLPPLLIAVPPVLGVTDSFAPGKSKRKMDEQGLF
jgi:serralysin